jgi:carboxyl-terminal processing protease
MNTLLVAKRVRIAADGGIALKRINLSMLLVALGVLLLSMSVAYLAGAASASGGAPQAKGGMLSQITAARDDALVGKALRMLEQGYFMEIDAAHRKELVYGALSGMFSELRKDPYKDEFSHFYNPELYSDLQAQTTGEYAGVGVLMGVTADGMYPEVVTVFPNTPAEDKDVQPNDIITEIEGADTFGLILPEVATKIKGKPGTTVKMKFFRPADGEFYDKELIRREVVYSSIAKKEVLPDAVGYIKISNFAEETGADFRKAMEELTAKGMKSLVIDLRDNTGGLLTAAAEIADCFVKEGLIVEVDYRSEGDKPLYADPKSKKYALPIVMLINANTASASEVLTSCLRDYGMAKVIGEKSFGKGVVQEVVPLEKAVVDVTAPDGKTYKDNKVVSAVAITVGKYYTKDRKEIHGVGIEPDIWYDFNSRLLEDKTLKAFDDRIRAKRDELIAIRAEELRYMRSSDADKLRAASIALKLSRGETVPDVAQIKPKEEEHSPLVSAGGNTTAAPKDDAGAAGGK